MISLASGSRRLVQAALALALCPALLFAELRVPGAMVLTDDGRTLAVALERGGGLALIDTRELKLKGISQLPGSFTDLQAIDDDQLLATDGERHRLLLLSLGDHSASITSTLSLPRHPVSLSYDANRHRAYVASLWSRQLTQVEFIDGNKPYLERSLNLPFYPREQLLLEPENQLLVADAFGGFLAVIDLASFKVSSVRKLPAHNIRGLARSPDGQDVLISHQRLNALARTTFEDIHWGMTMTNVVRAVPTGNLLDPETSLTYQSRLWHLGEVGNAAGDPATIAAIPDYKEWAVALAGTGEVAMGEFGSSGAKFDRLQTGSRPSHLVVDPKRNNVFIANGLEDLISVVDAQNRELLATISISPGLELSAEERGERLFFNARLSHQNWMSCHSCHSEGHTTGLLADTLGDGGYGAPKRIPSLFGLAGTEPFGWLGNKATLPDQIAQTMRFTMQQPDPLSEVEVADLTAYLQTLQPPVQPPHNSKAKAQLERGRLVFEREQCVRCHSGNTFTSRDAYEVGVRDEAGNEAFNPPSLQGLSLRDAYFHDGRYTDLEAILKPGAHKIERILPPNEIQDLMAYLRSL